MLVATRCPRWRISPWNRVMPKVGFSRASQRMSATRSSGIGGRPGLTGLCRHFHRTADDASRAPCLALRADTGAVPRVAVGSARRTPHDPPSTAAAGGGYDSGRRPRGAIPRFRRPWRPRTERVSHPCRRLSEHEIQQPQRHERTAGYISSCPEHWPEPQGSARADALINPKAEFQTHRHDRGSGNAFLISLRASAG